MGRRQCKSDQSVYRHRVVVMLDDDCCEDLTALAERWGVSRGIMARMVVKSALGQLDAAENDLADYLLQNLH